MEAEVLCYWVAEPGRKARPAELQRGTRVNKVQSAGHLPFQLTVAILLSLALVIADFLANHLGNFLGNSSLL